MNGTHYQEVLGRPNAGSKDHSRTGRHLGFYSTGNGAVRSGVPDNPTIEPNIKWIG